MNRSTGPPSKEDPRRRSVGQKPNQWDDDELCRLIPQGEPPRKPDIRRLRAEYRRLCLALEPLERAFWRLEQRRSRLADALANAGVKEFCKPRLTRKGSPPCR
jgi:hypothetical protein